MVQRALVNAFYERDLADCFCIQACECRTAPHSYDLDVMTWNWDGYAMKPNNYRLYHNRDTDQFQLILHGMDQMFENPYGGYLKFPRPHGGVSNTSTRN